MTQIMHRFPEESAFDRRRQLSDLDYVTQFRSRGDLAGRTICRIAAGLVVEHRAERATSEA